MVIVYALYNQTRNKIYIGQSSKLNIRIKRHNKELVTKKNSYTSLNDGKWIVVYKEEHITRIEAIKREKQLKSAKGREFIWKIIKNKYK